MKPPDVHAFVESPGSRVFACRLCELTWKGGKVARVLTNLNARAVKACSCDRGFSHGSQSSFAWGYRKGNFLI